MFCIKCYKLKYFRMIFRLIKYYQNQYTQLLLYHRNNNTHDFNSKVLLICYLRRKIVTNVFVLLDIISDDSKY